MGALKNPKFVLPVMSHSSGTVTATFANGSSLSRLISSDVTLVVNTLYMVYLVTSGGAAALRISTNVNSIGPIGFTTWTLLGAFYSNGMTSVGFGSFVNIYGVPRSGEIQQQPLTLLGGVSNPTKPAAGVDYAQWERDGGDMIYHYGFQASAAGSGGSGACVWDIPTGFTMNTARMNNLGSPLSNHDHLGIGRWGNAAIAYGGHLYYWNPSRVGLATWQDGGALIVSYTGSAQVLTTSAFYGGFNAILPITGWNKTQLVDL